MAIQLSHRERTVLRYAGLVLATLVVFVFALQATFPYDRVRDKLVEALAPNYDVTIGDVQRGILPGSVTLKAVTLTSRPTKAGDTPTVLFVDSIRVDLGILALITRSESIDLDVKLGPGRIKGNITRPKFGLGGIKIHVTASDLPGRDVPLGAWGMPPVIGKLDASVDLDVPSMTTKAGAVIFDWSKASGDLALGCPSGCTLGDGKTKIKPLLKNRSQQAMLADGIDFGKLTFDSLAIEGKFTPAVGDPNAHSSAYKPGKFDITKFDVKSKDGELHVDFSMTLAPELDESVVAGCLRFNVNESLLKTDEGKKTYATVTTSGAEKRADGLFHIKLTDHLKDMKRLNLECGPNAKPTNDEGSGRAGLRPNLRPLPAPGAAAEPPRPVEPPRPAEPPKAEVAKPAEPPRAVIEKQIEGAKPEGSSGSAPPPPEGAPSPEGAPQPPPPEQAPPIQ